jgi:hypothetical protein
MGNTKRNKVPGSALDALNQAFSIAAKNYKKRNGRLPECGFRVEFVSGMTHEEKLLEVFHALIRTGKTPQQAKELAPLELQEINDMREQFE